MVRTARAIPSRVLPRHTANFTMMTTLTPSTTPLGGAGVPAFSVAHPSGVRKGFSITYATPDRMGYPARPLVRDPGAYARLAHGLTMRTTMINNNNNNNNNNYSIYSPPPHGAEVSANLHGVTRRLHD